MSNSVLPRFSSEGFIESGFTFQSLIHFEFIFAYGVRECPVEVRYMIQDARGWCTGMTRGMVWGGRCERGAQDGEHVYTHGRFMLTSAKTNTTL